jgi:hypothetical protein
MTPLKIDMRLTMSKALARYLLIIKPHFISYGIPQFVDESTRNPLQLIPTKNGDIS